MVVATLAAAIAVLQIQPVDGGFSHFRLPQTAPAKTPHALLQASTDLQKHMSHMLETTGSHHSGTTSTVDWATATYGTGLVVSTSFGPAAC